MTSTRTKAPSPTLTAVLFAGGSSRRMGADKAMLTMHGEPMWLRQLNLLRALAPAKMVVSARAKPEWLPQDVELIEDRSPSRGPLSGLAAALNAARTTHLLALAVDLPRMDAVHLKRLWTSVEPQRGVIPATQLGLEPLCAIYPVTVEALTTASEMLASNDFSLQHFARTLIAHGSSRRFDIGEADLRYYLNANTPEDFAAASH